MATPGDTPEVGRGVRWLAEGTTPSRDELGHGIRWLAEHTPDEDVQQAHLRSLRAAVAARPEGAVVAGTAGTPTWVRRVAIGTTWGIVAAVPGAAVAAEGTKPGDLLYGVKRAGEPVRALFDPDVAARHRLEELAFLLAEDADDELVDRALEDARAAAGDFTDELDALERAAEERRARRAAEESEDSPDDEPATRATDDEDTDASEDSPDDEPTTRATDDEDTDASEDSPDDEPSPRSSATDDEDSPDDEPSPRSSATDQDDEDDTPGDEDSDDEHSPDA